MPMPLSSDKLHLTMTKSSTFSGLRDALLAVTTFPAAENTLSDFELAAGTGKTILTRCERSVKYTLQLSWFTLPKTRPEPDPEPGLLTITRPEPDPKSKSATRQALIISWMAKIMMLDLFSMLLITTLISPLTRIPWRAPAKQRSTIWTIQHFDVKPFLMIHIWNIATIAKLPYPNYKHLVRSGR